MTVDGLTGREKLTITELGAWETVSVAPLALVGPVGDQRGRDHAEGTADRPGAHGPERLELEGTDVARAVAEQVEALGRRIGVLRRCPGSRSWAPRSSRALLMAAEVAVEAEVGVTQERGLPVRAGPRVAGCDERGPAGVVALVRRGVRGRRAEQVLVEPVGGADVRRGPRGVLSLAPLPENMLACSTSLSGVCEAMPTPGRLSVWSWFCQKMLLAMYACCEPVLSAVDRRSARSC